MLLARAILVLVGAAVQGSLPGAAELADLEAWLGRFERSGPEASVAEVQALEVLVADLHLLSTASPKRREDVALALLDLAGVRTAAEERARSLGRHAE